MHIKYLTCAGGSEPDEVTKDPLRVIICPGCRTSFVLPLTQADPQSGGSGDSGDKKDDFDDFFELEEKKDASPKEVPPQKKGEPPSEAGKEDLTASAAEFLQDAFDRNVEQEKEPDQVSKPAQPEKGEPSTDDEVFGGLDGFEEFLSVSDEAQEASPKLVSEPQTPKPPPQASAKKPLGSEMPATPKPPKPEPVKPSPKADKDRIDDVFEELFGEPPKEETPKPPPKIETPPPKKTEVKAGPKPTVVPPKQPKSLDTVSDEAFEALFHDVKEELPKEAPKDKPVKEEVSEIGLGLELPKKRRFNIKLILMILLPLLVVSALAYFVVFTKRGVLGISYYSYFVEGYRKPDPEAMRLLNQKFDEIKEKLKKDYYPDYVYSVRELKNILAQDPRYVPGHAYLVYALLFSSGDPLNQNIKKEIEAALNKSEKLNPGLNEGILARAFYNYRLGNMAEAEKRVMQLLNSKIKDPLAYEILGGIYFSRANYSQAESNFREALKLDSNNLRVKHSLAMSLYNEGGVDEALGILNELRSEPLNHMPSKIDWNYIQWVNFKKKELAKTNFTKIFEDYSDKLSGFDYARVASYISDMLYEERKYDRALAILDKGLKKDPFNVSVVYRLGVINLEQGNHEKSIPYLKKATGLAPGEVSYHVAYAKALRFGKMLEDSLSEVAKALEIEPNNIQALYEKGLTQKEAGNLDEALVSFGKIKDINPRHISTLIEIGDLKVAQKKFFQAERSFNEAISINYKIARAHSGLGIAYMGLGKRKEALREFKIAERLSPNNAEIILNVGKSLLAMNRLGEAKNNFEQVLKLGGNDVEANEGLGDILFTKGRYSQAAKVYRDALKSAPKNVDLKVKLARAQIEIREFKPALEGLLEASKLAVDYFPVHLYLGIAYRNLGNMDDALRELERSTSLKPESSLARFEYGSTLMMNAQVPAGLHQFRKAVELDPKNIKAYEKLVDFYFDSGDMAKAVDYSKKILDVDPRRWKSRLKMAECYRRMGKGKLAYRTYIRVIKQHGSDPQAYIGAGKVLEESRQYASAMNLYKRAARVAPRYPAIHYHLGFIYKYLEQNDKAIQSFRTYLKLSPDSPEAPDIRDEVEFLKKSRRR